MRNKYNVNSLNEKVKYFNSRDVAVAWTDTNGNGYLTEVFNKETQMWEEIPGIDPSIRSVINWVKDFGGWRKAARLKRAAWIAYRWEML